MTDAYSEMMQQMMESGQYMLRAFNPAAEGFKSGKRPSGFEGCSTMTKEAMEAMMGEGRMR